MNIKDNVTLGPTTVERRQFLLGMFTGCGALGLRSLLLGLPAAFLTRRALAAPMPTGLIFSTERGASPINANAPGTYISGIAHDSRFAPVNVNLGGTNYSAAPPWANLPNGLRQRLNVIHVKTSTNAHTEDTQVLQLNSRLLGPSGSGTEMLPSAIAQELAESMGTITKKPMQFGNVGAAVTSRTVPLNIVPPSALEDLVSESGDMRLEQLAQYRDTQLDALYASLRGSGTAAQRRFLDSYALSRAEARNLGEGLAALVADINGDSLNDRIIASVAAIVSKSTPVAILGEIRMGGDNHGDSDLNTEVRETESGMQAIGTLWNRLNALGAQDQVTFALMNVFGRTLRRNSRGGRDHNREHNVMFVFGPNVNPGVTGGLRTLDNAFGGQALGINSQNGSTNNPDISVDDTLQSAAKSLMAVCGVDRETIDRRVSRGKVIESVVREA